MVDDFSSKNAQPGNRGLGESALTEFLKRLTLFIADDEVLIFPPKPDIREGFTELRNFDIQITDVLIGPF